MEPTLIDLTKCTHVFTIETSPSSADYTNIVVTLSMYHNDKVAEARIKQIQSIVKPFTKETSEAKEHDYVHGGYKYDDAPDHEFLVKSEAQIIKANGIILNMRRVKKWETSELRFNILTDSFTVELILSPTPSSQSSNSRHTTRATYCLNHM